MAFFCTNNALLNWSSGGLEDQHLHHVFVERSLAARRGNRKRWKRIRRCEAHFAALRLVDVVERGRHRPTVTRVEMDAVDEFEMFVGSCTDVCPIVRERRDVLALEDGDARVAQLDPQSSCRRV